MIAKLHQVKKVQMYMYLNVKSKFSNLYTFQKNNKNSFQEGDYANYSAIFSKLWLRKYDPLPPPSPVSKRKHLADPLPPPFVLT